MNGDSTYTPGHTDNAVSFMRHRRAATHAAFALDLFKSGMTVLDCGCGPGSITLDLARLVAPGAVTGVDAQGEQFAEGREAAAREGLDVRFEEANVTQLPLADASFDAVFSHALFEHLPNPAGAAREIARVLKPGGFFAVRSPDWGGFMLYPYLPVVEQAVLAYQKLVRDHDGDPQAGRKLPAILRAVGFTNIKISATYEIYEDPKRVAEYLALQLDRGAAIDTPEGAAMRRWSKDPDALFAQAWVEVIGWKDPHP
jgi:ubiquinone/menaquinone biosynthesis C-methylase UbiE